MNPIVQNVIGGARRQPGGAERYRAVNPAKLDDVVAEYAFSSASDIAAAIDIARGETLTKAGLLLRTRAKELGALMTREMGKPVAEATAEADYAGKVLQFYGAEAQRPFGETLNSGRPNVHYYTVREPIGVIGAITPWNFPFSIACWKLGPALVAGNTVVWKPAPHHPFCSQAVLEALLESGLPEGVVNLVHGGGA